MSKNIIQSNATVMFHFPFHTFLCILEFACINCTHAHAHTYSKSIIASMHMTLERYPSACGEGDIILHHIARRYMASFPATHLLAPFLTHRILHVLTCKRWFDSVIIADTLLHAVMHWREGYGFRCILSEYCHHRRFFSTIPICEVCET